MRASILQSLHRAAGAEYAAGAEPPLLLTYGDVPAEYEAATRSAVLFDQTDRALVAVTGADRFSFLHGLLANRVRGLEPGQGNANLLLSPKGKVVHAFDLDVREDALLLSAPPGTGPDLVEALETYHFSEDVALADATERHAPLALCGPRARAVVARATGFDGELEEHATARVEHDGGPIAVTALPVAGSPGLRLDAGPERAAALWRALVAAGAQPAGRVVWDSLRVEAGQAEPGVDVTDAIYPQEARLEAAFSLDKGCYIGQEVVAKIDTYGGLNKRLMALRVEHDDPVPAGTRLVQREDGQPRDLGVVTSWAYSFALDTGLVLAFVKRKHQDPGTVFELDPSGAKATIVELPVRPAPAES